MNLREYVETVRDYADPRRVTQYLREIPQRFKMWSETRGDVKWAGGDKRNLEPRLNLVETYLKGKDYRRTNIWLNEIYNAIKRGGRVDQRSAKKIGDIVGSINSGDEALKEIKDGLEELFQNLKNQ